MLAEKGDLLVQVCEQTGDGSAIVCEQGTVAQVQRFKLSFAPCLLSALSPPLSFHAVPVGVLLCASASFLVCTLCYVCNVS